MAEQIYKLTPNRDLQCYFLTPSAIAAMSSSSETGFTVSGKWRQQFDWAVVEWNRDNTFEHPSLRYLPDGDLSGLTLSYTEQRQGCLPIESNVYPVVAWNMLRIWATPQGGAENVYTVSIESIATPIGNSIPASATMTLVSSPGAGNRVGVAMLEQHYYYTVAEGDSLSDIAAGVAVGINGNVNIPASADFIATSSGPSVTITCIPNANNGWSLGANCNRVMVYGFTQGDVLAWQEPAVFFSGGEFPGAYNISIDFGALLTEKKIPTNNVRKLRWTWAADLQPGSFNQTEFEVQISNWSVTGQNRIYSVAGPGSRRIEDNGPGITYVGSWISSAGNYSGSTIQSTVTPGDTCTITYQEANPHELYLGTRLLNSGANILVTVDGQTLASPTSLFLAGEDVLVRSLLGIFAAGSHTVSLQHQGPASNWLYFDFLEIAYPSTNLPDFDQQNQLSLATDWDTYHSQSLPAERTAWLIQKLGFFGRVNHYAGALWFYEIFRPETQYASLTVTFNPDQVDPGTSIVVLNIAPAVTSDTPDPTATPLQHLVLFDDTPATVAQAFAGLINSGTNLLWASATGNQLTLTARAMGQDGNNITAELDPSSHGYTLTGGNTLTGGVYGAPYDLALNSANDTLIATAYYWRTDLSASPSINRAARDWHSAYFQALKGYGIDVVTSFSTELLNGDPSSTAGIVQQYPDGTPVILTTPSVQTNFSPTAISYWTKNYMEIASLANSAGLQPYLQFGEVQWWYFPNGSGMPFYDAYTQQQFQAKYGVAMQTIPSNTADPSLYPNEMLFLPTLIGDYTAAIRAAVLAQYPNCRFEVLYPTDTNDYSITEIVNFAATDWVPGNLNCLKTESFTFTGNNNLDQSTYSIGVSASKGFTTSQRSHLVGIGSAWTAWGKEVDIAQSQGLESIVLFALDQYCLIGYAPPPFVTSTRTLRQG